MIIFTKEWQNFVKGWEKKSKVGWSTGKKVLEYVKSIEDLIECEYKAFGIKEDVYISLGSCFRTYKMYNDKGYKIELAVKKETEGLYEMVEDFNMQSVLMNFGTVIGHELAHVKNHDLIGITAKERIVSWNKLNRSLSIFSECRADINGKSVCNNCFNGWSNRWVWYSETNPLKSGYLISDDRKKMMKQYDNYTPETMLEIFDILKPYGFTDYVSFCNYIKKEVNMDSPKGKWVKELLFIR